MDSFNVLADRMSLLFSKKNGDTNGNDHLSLGSLESAKNISDMEGGSISERSLLVQKAKEYGIKANLSTEELRSSIQLYEQGTPEKIPKQNIKKGKEGNFIMKHKKACAGISTSIITIIVLIIIFSLLPKQED